MNNINFNNSKQKFACYVPKKNRSKFLMIEAYHPQAWNASIPDVYVQAQNNWLTMDSAPIAETTILDAWTKSKDAYIV